MNEVIDEPAETLFTPLLQSGPIQILLTLLIVAIGIYHIAVCIRTLLGHRASPPPGVHAILLFSGPCLLVLSVAAMLPTTFPDLFVFGIDAEYPLKYTLQFTSFLGWLCITIFIPGLVLCLFTLNRHQPARAGALRRRGSSRSVG